MERVQKIPVTQWNRLMRIVEKISAEVERGEILSESQAAGLLGIKIKTLNSYRHSGKIPEACYKTTVTGSVIYFKSKLCGLS